MGHMKKLYTALAVLFVSMFVSTSKVSAHEGDITMSGANVSCTAISLWQSGQYQVTGRCDGLVYPYQTQYDRYMLWAKTAGSGDIVPVGEITRGYFQGFVGNAFTTLFVTAETSSNPHRPSSYQVASGSVTPFTFEKTAAATPAPASTETTNTSTTMTVQQAASSTSTSGSTVGAVVGKIVTSLLVIILVIVGVAIGASLIFRSRGSVSA